MLMSAWYCSTPYYKFICTHYFSAPDYWLPLMQSTDGTAPTHTYMHACPHGKAKDSINLCQELAWGLESSLSLGKDRDGNKQH